MALTPKTLAAIQAAGAAIYSADAALKEAVKSYADQVKQAMLENPFDVGNDNLFGDWKTTARLSRAVEQVEVEFQRIYRAASDLSLETGSSVLALPSFAPAQESVTGRLEMVQEIEATDAVVKKQRKPTKSTSKKQLSGNTAKVLSRLVDVLNHDEFVKINRTAIASEIGIPTGSIGASISRLTQTGHLIEGAFGEFKLGTPKKS